LVAAVLLAGALAACSKSEPVAGTATVAAASPAAKPQDEPHPPGERGADGLPAEALAQAGEKLFLQNCATCHMADGSGVPFLQPPIKDSAWISSPDPQPLLTLILRGSPVLGEAAQAFENDMAPQSHLTDAEIAALATFARQHFSATPPAKPVSPAEVALARSRPGLP
jgi:mono/diheme cytochrome c family protein